MNRLHKTFRSADSLAVLLLAVWPLLLFWSAALGQKVFVDGDIGRLFLPIRLALADALAEGRLPLWTPDMQSGFPLSAEGQVAALYPPSLLLARFLPIRLAINYAILFHLAWAAVGMYVFTRACGLGVAGAFLGGFVFGSNGFFVAHLQHLPLMATAAWLPWLLFGQDRYQRAHRERAANAWLWFLLTAFALAMMLFSGSAHIALLILILFSTTGVLGAATWNRSGPRAFDVTALPFALGTTIVTIALGAALSAAQLLPTAELMSLSVRGQELGERFATAFSLQPEGLTQFIAPFARLGAPVVLNQEYWGYLGVAPLILASSAVLLRRDARTWFFLVFGLVSLSLALGESNPIYAALSSFPLFDRFRVPARFLLLTAVSASFLAGAGLDELRLRLRDVAGNRWVVGVIAATCVVVVGALAIRESATAAFWLDAGTVLPWFVILATALVIALAWRERIHRRAFAAIMIGLTVIDLTVFSFPFSFSLNSTVTPGEAMHAPLSISSLAPSSAPFRIFTNVYNETLRPNHPMIYGIQAAQVDSPLAVRRNEDYLRALSPAMLNLANIRYFFGPGGPPAPEFAEPTASLALDLFQNEIEIPPTQAAQIEITSYGEHTENLSDGSLAGELRLIGPEGEVTLPIRLGIETADWAHDGVAQVWHNKPALAIPFPGYSIATRRAFTGLKYVSRFTLPNPFRVTRLGARSPLSEAQLTIERVLLIDEKGESVSLAAVAQRNDFAVVFKSHAVAVLENRDVMPRAFMVHRAQVVDDARVLGRKRERGFRPDQVALLSDGEALQDAAVDATAANDLVSLAEYKPERVSVRVNAVTKGYLILADTWYPGWDAWVDGKSAPVRRADYIFRAVLVPPGEHTVVFEYRPASFYAGSVIGGTTLMACLILTIIGFKRR